MIDDETLEEFLRERDLLGAEGLREARELQREEDRPLYDVVLDHGLVDEEPLVAFVSDALNVSVVDPNEQTPDDDVLELIPREVAFEKWVLPLEMEETDGRERLVLAMRNPIDMMAMDAVADHTDADIRPVLAGPEALKEGLREAYDPDVDEFDLSGMDFSSDVMEVNQDVADSFDQNRGTQVGPPHFSATEDSEVHEAQTVEARNDKLQERIEEIEAGFAEAPDPENDTDSSTSQTHLGGNEQMRLVERIAGAADDLDDEQRALLESSSPREILASALIALLEQETLSVEDLLESLRSS